MKVLYICTHNRCRSILFEAITNHLSEGEVIAKSAGSQPVSNVHPLTLKHLQQESISIEGLSSQSWDELESFEPDLVITVCDNAAGEACPVWFGKAVRLHWGLADPSKVDDAVLSAIAFKETINQIQVRVDNLIAINAKHTADTLTDALKELQNGAF